MLVGNLERIPPQTPLVQMREEIDPAARSLARVRPGRLGRKPQMFHDHVWPLKLCVSSVFAPEPRPPDTIVSRAGGGGRPEGDECVTATSIEFEIDTERFRPVSSRPEKFILSSAKRTRPSVPAPRAS